MELWFSDYQTEKVKVSVKVQKQLFWSADGISTY